MKHINHALMATFRIHSQSAATPESLIFGSFWVFHASAGTVWAVRNMEEPSGPTGD
jgi:hypothetical protein